MLKCVIIEELFLTFYLCLREVQNSVLVMWLEEQMYLDVGESGRENS